jgi:hypothetical protein
VSETAIGNGQAMQSATCYMACNCPPYELLDPGLVYVPGKTLSTNIPHGSRPAGAGRQILTQDYGAILELRMEIAPAVTSIEQTYFSLGVCSVGSRLTSARNGRCCVKQDQILHSEMHGPLARSPNSGICREAAKHRHSLRKPSLITDKGL